MKKSMKLSSRSQFKKCSSGGRSPPEDLISSLPDEILLFILSFLTFKQVAKMSVVSRRWVKLWVHNPVLNFHAQISDALYINKLQRQNYVDWVNNVLKLHKARYLKEFKIFCDLDNYHRKDIARWLVYALARKVENLELNFLCAGRYPVNVFENYVFPKILLNLSHAKAFPAAVNSNSRGNLFSRLDFKSLKSLSLKSVDVNGEAINFFLHNCPYLERLEVAGTSKLVNLVISGPTLVLKYLQIMGCNDLKVLTISNCNLVSLNISAVDDLTLAGLPMLVELFILGSSRVFSHCFSQASSCHLQLEALTLEVSDLKDIIQLSNLSQLTKLKKLDISVDVMGDESLTKLFSFMNSCPHLMEFVFRACWSGPKRTSRALCKGEKCSLNCLEVFEFMGYYGRVSDVEMIMHMVENAVCLKKIIIDPRNLVRFDNIICAEEDEARSVALSQFEGLRESIPPHIDLLIR